MGQFNHFFYRSETAIKKQFFLNFIYCFLFLVWYFIKTCVNCVLNCVTQKFTPLRSEFYKLILFRCHFMDNLGNCSTYMSPLNQKSFFLNLNFCFVLGSMVSKNIYKLRHKLKNAKNLPKLTWSWQNKPWYIQWNIAWAGGKSRGRSSRYYPRAHAIFHRISRLE